MNLTSFFRASSLSFFAATLVASPASVMAALPQGLQVTHGDLQLSEQGNHLRINQLSQQAIANWQSFSIGSGQRVDIQQPGIDSVLLNRVLGADPSQLLGQLHANGRVYLINPNGVLVGPDAQINAAEFLASALDIADHDFLNGGDLHFSGDSARSVVNLGRITATNGDVYLLAYQVVNSGEIHAPKGVAALAAGHEIVLTPEGDQRILVKTDLNRPTALTGVENSGILEAAQAELKAAGGHLYELAINQSGIIRATGSTVRDGRILLTADGGNLRVGGALTASEADGSGGEILLGGDYRGANAKVDNAANTLVTADAVIDVSATGTQGDAGRAIIWADQQTHFFGTIRGQGGSAGGGGAFAEVSGKQLLDFRGLADLRATNGAGGQLLLDPASLTIQATGPESNLTTSGTNPFTFGQTSPSGPSILTVATLESQLALSHVQLDTSLVQDFYSADGSIVVADAVSWTSGNRLTFLAGNSVLVNADLNAGSGDIVFALGFAAENIMGLGGSTTGSLEVASGTTIRADEMTIQRNTGANVIGTNSFGDAFGAVQIDGILDVNRLDIQYSGAGGRLFK